MRIKAGREMLPIPWLLGTGMFLLTCLAVVIVFWLVLERAMQGDIQRVPFSLRSVLSANYQADPRGTRIPAVQLGLIDSAVRDLERTDRPTGTLLATIIAYLQTPVPTVTPSAPGMPGATPTPASQANTPTPQQAGDPTSTLTPVPPGSGTPTSAVTLSPTASALPSVSATWAAPTTTPVIIIPTATSVRPTQPRPTRTNTPALTSVPQPTSTQPAPTVPLPTATQPPPTPRPPTATQPPPPTSTPKPYPGPTTPPYP